MSTLKPKRTDFMLKEKEIIDAAKKEPNQSKPAWEITKNGALKLREPQRSELPVRRMQ